MNSNNEPAFLIVNPNASKGKKGGRKKDVVECFKKRGYNVVVGYTSEKGHGELLSENAVRNGFKVIIAAGGDGTVNEVVNGIMKAPGREGAKMGIVPLGRGNDFAWIAKIPTDVNKAVDLIVKGETKKTDVGLCKGPEHPEGRFFLNGAGFGFEPMVNFRAMEYKRLNGMPSYIAAFLYILRNPPKGYKIRLSIDGEERDLESQQISIANGQRMGSAFMMTPLASIDDGKFDVMFTNHLVSGWGLIKLVLDFLRGAHVRDKRNFTYVRASKVSIVSSEKDVQAHVDGEIFTKEGTQFSLELLPGAIDLIR